MAVMQVPIPMMEISHAKGADKKQNKQTKKPQRNKQRIEKKKKSPDVARCPLRGTTVSIEN